MGGVNRKFSFGPESIIMWGILACLLLTLNGCSTASWIIHHATKPDDLLITEADVDTMIEELSLAQTTDSDTILYNKTIDRYELTPDTYRRAVRDGIIRKIQDNKINRFLENYRPETFAGSLEKDIGTAGIVILLLGLLAGVFY